MVGNGCLWSRSKGSVIRPLECTILNSLLTIGVRQLLLSKPAFNHCDLNRLGHKILLLELFRGLVFMAVV